MKTKTLQGLREQWREILDHWDFISANPDECFAIKLVEALESRIGELEAKVPRWIPVETPPQKSGRYLVTLIDGDNQQQIISPYDATDSTWMFDRIGFIAAYWMPIPDVEVDG